MAKSESTSKLSMDNLWSCSHFSSAIQIVLVTFKDSLIAYNCCGRFLGSWFICSVVTRDLF